MRISENLKMAISSIANHKMRSLLTILGIIIGVGAVITVVAIGNGGEELLKAQIAGPGNTVDIYYQPTEEEASRNPNIFEESIFTEEDISVLSQIPGVEDVIASSSTSLNTSYKNKNVDTRVIGVNEVYIKVHKIKSSGGRDFTQSDISSGNRVAIISESLRKSLFEDDLDVIGETIWAGGQPLQIIGVTDSSGGIFSISSNNLYIPISTYRSVLGEYNYSEISLKTSTPDDIKQVGIDAPRLLNELHQTKESYQVVNLEEISKGIGRVTQVMTSIIGAVAGISLLVGGIGVMNIMLVSVTERTNEIGIRRALGATRNQILAQFLIEALTLSLIGGAIGVILGISASSMVSYLAGWPSIISWKIVVTGLLFSVVIGVIFGILPAQKASRLDPIQSLRYE